MRRVLVQQWVCADGMVAGPGGEGDVFAAVGDFSPSDRHNAALLESVDPWGARSLLRAGLVDEVELLVAPVLLGTGRPLLDGTGPAVLLTLQEAEAWPGGTLRARYTVA
jgi:hypothetical protein